MKLRHPALPLAVGCAFLTLSCAQVARAPFEAVRPDRSPFRKVVELRVGDPAEGAATPLGWSAGERRPIPAPRNARVLDRPRPLDRPVAVAAAPVRANPCAPSPSPGGSGGDPSGGWGGGNGGGGLVGDILIGILVTLVFGLFVWGGRKLWHVFFPPAPLPPTGHEPGRVLALVRLDAEPALRATAAALGAPLGLATEAVHPLRSTDDGLLVFSHPDADADLDALIAGLEADPRVLFAQRDYWFETVGRYDDPFDAVNWGPERIGAGRLHAQARGTGVRVAVVDTGVDASHPDLRGRVVEQIDTTGTGLSADLHGTALAGVIAAAPDDGFGTWGVAPGAELVGAKACRPDASGGLAARCWSSTLARGIDFAIRREARVLNLSVAGPDERLVTRMVNAALRKGSLVVAAAGNGGRKSPPLYPGALEGVLTVTAIDARDELYEQATRGDQVDLSAPGVEIVAAAPDGSFPLLSGTSFATAHASGAAALLWERYPALSSAQLEALLVGSAVDLGEGERDPEYGSGRLDVCAAAERLSDGVALCALEPTAPAP